jgi:hypothetical protein
MFILSFGMQKSASSLLTKYAIDLLRAVHPSTGQDAFEKLVSEDVIPGVGHFPWGGWEYKHDLLCDLAVRHGPFVLKSHGALTLPVQRLIESGAKPIVSIRDPRDIILSLIDHGAMERARGGTCFAEHTDVATTLPKVMEICAFAHIWLESELSCVFRYQDLVLQPEVEIARLAGFIGIQVKQATIASLVDEERAGRKKWQNRFNTGLPTRFREEMSQDDIKLCNDTLGFYIKALGYPID